MLRGDRMPLARRLEIVQDLNPDNGNQSGREFIILLAGGDKRTQDQDIRTARELAQSL